MSDNTTAVMTDPTGRPTTTKGYVELALVLGMSLGKSAVYSALNLAEKLTRPEPLSEQTTQINTAVTPDRPILDLCFQVARIGFPMVPAMAALYLLHLSHGRGGATIGFDLKRPLRDLWQALAITAIIGIGGIGVYVLATNAGINTRVAPANLAEHWWTIPVYLGLAWMNGFLEEVVMIGFVLTRLRDKAWSWTWAIVFSAVVRGSYHLYQGIGGFIGNVIMGVLFGLFYARTRRVMPLVIAHFLIDAVIFVGYPLVKPWWGWLP